LNNKINLYIIIILCIIGILILSTYNTRKMNLLKVNDTNKDMIYKYVEGKRELNGEIKKIGYNIDWGNGYIYICYTSGKTEKIYLIDGDFDLGKLSEYIIENGYEERNHPIFVVFIFGGVIILSVIQLKVIKKNNKLQQKDKKISKENIN